MARREEAPKDLTGVRQVAERTAVRASVIVDYLLDEWLGGHPLEETTRASYWVAIEKSPAAHLGHRRRLDPDRPRHLSRSAVRNERCG